MYVRTTIFNLAKRLLQMTDSADKSDPIEHSTYYSVFCTVVRSTCTQVRFYLSSDMDVEVSSKDIFFFLTKEPIYTLVFVPSSVVLPIVDGQREGSGKEERFHLKKVVLDTNHSLYPQGRSSNKKISDSGSILLRQPA